MRYCLINPSRHISQNVSKVAVAEVGANFPTY